MAGQDIQISIIVPLFNEEQVIQESYERIKRVIEHTGKAYEIIFVNDGSTDKTEELANKICNNDSHVKLLSFSRNFGHQMAITAGMDHACGMAVIVIDADLQDPPEVIIEMIKEWENGYDVVYGKRIKRKGETFFKKATASIFYRVLKHMTDVEIPVDTGDFRLIDRNVCNYLKSLPERNRYVRGLISWLGFKQTGVEFIREERFAGETKYSLKKMMKFSADAITSFSYKPLKIATFLGTTVSILSFVYLMIILYKKLLTHITISGESFIIAACLLMNGLVLIVLGIIGEYIGRIYDESKGRPLYIIKDKEGYDNVTEDKSND